MFEKFIKKHVNAAEGARVQLVTAWQAYQNFAGDAAGSKTEFASRMAEYGFPVVVDMKVAWIVGCGVS